MTRFRTVRLGYVLQRAGVPVTVNSGTQYKTAGVRSFGNGIFESSPIDGSETKYKTLWRVASGQVVYSKLFGWEGAVAFADDRYDGYLFSGEFPIFSVDSSLILRDFIAYVVQWREFWEQLRGRTTGMGNRRQRVNPEQFLQAQIPLPGLDEQRRIVAVLDRSFGAVRYTENIDRESHSEAIAASAEESIAARLSADGWQERRLEEVADINPKRVPLSADDDVMFVPMSAVDDKRGKIVFPERRSVSSVKSGYTQFRSGDVIFAGITPYMQNGKSAIVAGNTDWGYGSSEFHVIRSRGDVSAEWLHFCVRRAAFRRDAARALTGTAGQQRVPAEFVKKASVLVPPDSAVEERALVTVRKLTEQRQRLRSALRHSANLRSAIRPSLLNAAFSGEL